MKRGGKNRESNWNAPGMGLALKWHRDCFLLFFVCHRARYLRVIRPVRQPFLVILKVNRPIYQKLPKISSLV